MSALSAVLVLLLSRGSSAVPLGLSVDDFQLHLDIFQQGGHADCYSFNPGVQGALEDQVNAICYREPADFNDTVLGEYSVQTGGITLVTENLIAEEERDYPAATKVTVYEEAFHATQSWGPLERWHQLEDCLDAAPPGDGTQARHVWNAVQAAAELHVALNEMAAQLDQICNRGHLCGLLTEENKKKWKKCIDSAKDYFKQNEAAAKAAAARLDAELAASGVNGDFTFTCNDGSSVTIDTNELRDEKTSACGAGGNPGQIGQIGQMSDSMKAKCVDIDAELKAVCE